MNAQREVVYKRRRHALFGERLKLDIANMLYDTCELIVQNTKAANDFKSFEFDLIRYFSITSLLLAKAILQNDRNGVDWKSIQRSIKILQRKNVIVAQESFPIVKNIYEDKDNQFERIVVPFTDGVKSLNVTDLKRAYETEGNYWLISKNIT
jgi:preprotein translocase subunit SecA